MKRNIEKELSILGITNNIDKLKYITNQTDSYCRTLYSKKYKFREYLIEWINQQTPLLNDEIYNITTKIYWIFNNITSWNDVRVRCHYCHKPYYNINVISIRKGYRKFCSHRCSTLSSETQLKLKNTNFIKYGDEKYINVDKIKQRYYSKTKEQKQEIKDKRKNTLIRRTGYGYVLQNPSSVKKYKNTMSNKTKNEKEYINKKREQTNIRRYGYNSDMQNELVKFKSRQSKLRKYGDEYFNNRKKHKQTLKQRYGDENYVNIQKIIESKRKNNSFNVSNPEKECYKLLCSVFGEENVKKQYDKDQRYPFLCDFYIKSKDLFIEYNGHWTHGKHPFDMNNMNDNDKLKKWEEKSQNSNFYKKAVEVWTIRDIKKRNTAKQNNLNYLEFFNMKQFNDWISTVNR